MMVASVVSGFTNQAIRDWAANRLEPACDVYSDGLNSFAVPSELGHAHTVHTAKRRQAGKASAIRWGNTSSATSSAASIVAIIRFAPKCAASAI
jgi:hypothetical protein